MESRQEILVGLSISLTGMFSAQGRQALDGLRLWQSYVNGREGITIGQAAPRPVRLVFYDDQSRASLARGNALRLLRQDIKKLRACSVHCWRMSCSVSPFATKSQSTPTSLQLTIFAIMRPPWVFSPVGGAAV